MRELFEPKAVALIGVSRQTGVGAYNGLEMMLRYGYRGRIYVVHPQTPEILGHQAYARVTGLPEVPEVAVIAVGRDRVLAVAEDCLSHGIRWLIVISQGLGDADAQGQEIQEQLTARVRQAGARLVGPNTMGVLNVAARFSTAFVDLPHNVRPAPVGLIAQSGAPQVGAESFTGSLGKAIDIGNAADVGFLEVLEYFAGDPDTRVISLHVEGLKQGREFLDLAGRINRSKPIVVFKTGRSEAGARAALSHTGSLTGADDVFQAALQRAGLTRVYGATEMVEAVQGFLKLPPLRGPRLGVVTASGALGIMTADALGEEGLGLGELPEGLRATLEPKGPYWHKLHNPVDLWPIGMLTGDFLGCAREAILGLLADEGIDGVVGVLPSLSSPLHRNIIPTPEFITSLSLEAQRKPLVLALYGDFRQELERQLEHLEGVACCGSVESAARVLGHLYRYEQARQRPAEVWAGGEAAGGRAQGPEAGGRIILGEEALGFLAGYGIPGVVSRLSRTPEEAAATAEAMGYPVVLKVEASQWVHKTEHGGVLLNLRDAGEVEAGFRRLEERVRRANPRPDLQGILVQRQLTGREILLGVKRDATFGPVVVCGLGGIYTEVWRDVAQTLAPVTAAQARELLGSLKSAPLLQGFRGEAAVDLDRLAQAVADLSRLAMAEKGLQELDINPLMATAEGCWAVDARIVFG